MSEPSPLSQSEFDALMRRCGPFEPAPQLAVGVSGGADSLALTLLLQTWVESRGGRLTALTVDHGLRLGSAEEAIETGRVLTARGLRHVVLRWCHDGPRHGVQAAARAARLQLLSDWCAREGVLHLALAHHAADQAETLVQRLWSGSGLAGLAAMAPVRELAHCRLLRPLIPIPPERLRATLQQGAVPWLEDPSNDDSRFGRVQARRFLRTREEPLRTRNAALGAAQALGAWRGRLDVACAELAAEACRLHPLGYVELLKPRLLAAPPVLVERLLRGLFQAVGGTAYPMSEREARAARGWLIDMPGQVPFADRPRWMQRFVAGRCMMMRSEDGRWLICRERRDLPTLLCEGPGPWLWDGRFLLYRKVRQDREARSDMTVSVRPFRPQNSGALASRHLRSALARVPDHALTTLPFVADHAGEARLPSISGVSLPSDLLDQGLAARFQSAQAVVQGPFTVA